MPAKKQAFDTSGLPISGRDWNLGPSQCQGYDGETVLRVLGNDEFRVENATGRAAFSRFVDEMIELRSEIARRKGGKG